VAIGAFAGASVLAVSLPAVAQTAPTTHHYRHAAASSSDTQQETVEQRIAGLHTALKITPDEEADWSIVAQSMRDNEAAMRKLVADRTAEAPHDSTAVEDLLTYERFSQAHVDGLKNLIGSFDTLYQSMPDDQKALADQVFHKYGVRGSKS
jgi:hypothetical protein